MEDARADGMRPGEMRRKSGPLCGIPYEAAKPVYIEWLRIGSEKERRVWRRWLRSTSQIELKGLYCTKRERRYS
jgi:hypothetical protein